MWDFQCCRTEDSSRNPTLLKTAEYVCIIIIIFVICSLTGVMTLEVMLIFISEVMSKSLSFSLSFMPLFLLLSKRGVANERSFQQLSPVLVLEVSDASRAAHMMSIMSIFSSSLQERCLARQE